MYLPLRCDMLRSPLLLGPYDRICCDVSYVIATQGWKHYYILPHCRKTYQLVHLSVPPNILNLYRSAAISSNALFNAVNSDPKVDVSTPFCRLLCHIIGARLQNMRILVIYCLVVCLPRDSYLQSSELTLISSLRLGISMGIDSWASL